MSTSPLEMPWLAAPFWWMEVGMVGRRGSLVAFLTLAGSLVVACGSTDGSGIATTVTPTTRPATSITATTDTSPTTLPVAGPPTGLLVAGTDGITLVPFEGDPVVIPPDRFYPDVEVAFDDGRGGLVYVALATQTLYRLRAGATRPEEVDLGRGDSRVEVYGVVADGGSQALLAGVVTAGGGEDEGERTEIDLFDLATGEATVLAIVPQLVSDASFASGVLVVERGLWTAGAECTWFDFFDANGAPLTVAHNPRPAGACELPHGYRPMLSADASTLVHSVEGDAVVTLLASGESFRLGGSLAAFDGMATALVVATDMEGESLQVVTFDPHGVVMRRPISVCGRASFYHGHVDVSPTATLRVTPPLTTCSATGDAFEPQPALLPAAVAAMRNAIVAAATACDTAALAAMAAPELDFNWSCCGERGGMEDDPERYWTVGELEGSPELEMLVRLLALAPARVSGGYVWPAAAEQRPDEIDWDTIDTVYEGPFEWMYELSRERRDYEGFRVEIRDDGAWTMFTVVIDPPYAG